METEALFTQILGLKELEVISIETFEDRYELSVRGILAEGLYPKCRKRCSRIKSYSRRTIRDLPISGKRVVLDLEVRQFECSCGNFFKERFEFVRANKHLTIRYEEYLYFRCKGVDLSYLAQKEELDWKTINELFYSYSDKEISNRTDWEKVTHLALDEIALRKGHNNYVVVMLDLLSGAILDIVQQRDKAFLLNYFQEKGVAFCQQIEVFCSDMWQAYLNCAKEVFPNATIVADRFHFFAKCQAGIEHARKSFRRLFPKADELKNLKWALLKNPEHLSAKQAEKLQKVFEKSDYHLLRLSWDARNTLRDIFNCPLEISEAEILIDQWIEGVKKFKLRYFFKFIDFYQSWKTVILNYFNGRFSTGKLEGSNNKLKLIKRRAFGFLDFDHFRTRAMVEFF